MCRSSLELALAQGTQAMVKIRPDLLFDPSSIPHGQEGLHVLTLIVIGHKPTPKGPPLPWTPRSVLVKLLEDDSADNAPCRGCQLIDALVVQGWLDSWHVQGALDMPVLTLTPFAAEQLQVELEPRGAADVPVWIATGDAPPYFIARKYHREWPLPSPHLVPDHRSDPGDPEYLLDDWTGEPIRLFQGPDQNGSGFLVPRR